MSNLAGLYLIWTITDDMHAIEGYPKYLGSTRFEEIYMFRPFVIYFRFNFVLMFVFYLTKL